MPRFELRKNLFLKLCLTISLFHNIVAADTPTAENKTTESAATTKATEAATQALGNITTSANKGIDPSDPFASGRGLTDIILNMEDHGWAVIDRIRNSTEFPVDIFYYKTLHDLLPPDTVIRIKSLKREYSLNAETAQAVEESSKNLKDKDSEKQKTESSEEKPPIETKSFRYLAARNIAGNFRLKADTTDPEDPATRFVVKKHIQSDLQTFLGLEAQINPGGSLRSKKNNEVILTTQSSLDFIVKSGAKSSDNFDSDFDQDAHWLLHAEGLTPQDPIDTTVGSYLKSCSLKNRNQSAFLSVLGAEDQAKKNKYQKPQSYWHWAQGIKWGDTSTFEYNQISFHDEGIGHSGSTDATYTANLEVWRVPLSRETTIPMDENSIAGLKYIFNNNDNAHPEYGKSRLWWMRNPEKNFPGEIIKKVKSTVRDGASANSSRWDTAGDHPKEQVFSTGYGVDTDCYNNLEQGLMIYNKLRDIEYMKSADQNGGTKIAQFDTMPDKSSLLNKWSPYFAERTKKSQRDSVLKQKRTVRYGDKIKLVSTGSCLMLFGADLPLPESKTGEKIVFGSHDDTITEYKKLTSITSPKDPDTKPEDYSWFYVKGPHAEGDSWNCKIGSPVKDGDVIRLEHFTTGRNLSVLRSQPPLKGLLLYGPNYSSQRDFRYKGTNIVTTPPGANASIGYPAKPKDHECMVGLNANTNGLGSSNDNFIIKFTEPADATLFIGQTFSLVQQNTKQNLWSQHAYYKPSGQDLFGLITALFPESDDDVFMNQWFVLANETDTLPVKDIGWTGLPDAAPQTSIGDKEELEIEVVKLGLSGNLGPGETLKVKMPLFKKEPKIGGFAKDTVPQFTSANIVELSPLLGKGVAWLEESLKTPNKTALFFRAKCGDNGDIQVILGNNLGLDFVWKIVLGGNNNQASYILKRSMPGGVVVDQKVMEVYKEVNPLAGAIPGQYTPYWISIDNGLIIVGVGANLGENIIMVWKDLELVEPVNRIGFGSGSKPVSYAEVRLTDPMDIKSPKNFYFSQNLGGKIIPLKPDSDNILTFNGENGPSNLIFKVPGNGTLVYNIDSEGSIYFFEQDNNKSFSADTSPAATAAKTVKIKNELTSTITKKIAKIKNVLDLQQFFTPSTPPTSPETLLKNISAFFLQHPDHSIKKYIDSLPEEKKLSDTYSNLKTMLTKPYTPEVQGTWDFAAVLENIKTITDEYLQEKFASELNSGSYTDKLKTTITAIVLGTTEEPVTDKTYALLVSDAAVATNVKNITTVNDHYRLSFKSFTTVQKERASFQDKIQKILQDFLKIILNELEKTKSYSEDNVNKVLVEQNKQLVELCKTAKIPSFNTGEIKNRLSSTYAILAQANSLGSKLFEKIFPEPLIIYYVQNISEFTSSCITFEKYLPTKNEYETLVSSKQQDSQQLDVAIAGGKNFWLSFNKNRFFLGEGTTVGDKLLLYAQDLSNPYEDINTIGFTSTATKKTGLSNIKIGNTIKLALSEQGFDYKQSKRIYDYSGSLQVISPYQYQLFQAAQQVEFKDIIGKKTLFPGKTPQQGALYYFTLALEANGFPTLTWTKEPENQLKIELEKRISIAQATSDAEFQASTYVQGGQNALSAMLGAAASITFAGLGTSQAVSAGEDKALAAAKFRANDAYVFTDNMGSMSKMASSSIPPEVLDNKDKAEAQLALGEKWTPSDVEKLQRLIPLYNSVLDYTIHPYVISSSKNRLFSGINSIYKAAKLLFAKAKTVDMTQLNLLTLLLKAYNNPYLFDPSDDQDKKLKETWYSYINELTQTILSSDQKELSLPACYGEYIWMPEEFKFSNKGSISFKAKTNNDVFVCFAPEAANIRNSDKDIYEIVFGSFNNQKSIIRAKSLDKAVATTVNPEALVNPIDLKQFWVSFNNGRIVLGTGDLVPENAIAQYNSETSETTKPEWGEYSYSVKINPSWLKYAIGDETGFKGKDLLLKDLQQTADPDEIDSIKASLADCKTQLGKLFSQKSYAYQTQATQQGYFSTDPFFWQDPYFNPKTSKIKRVGLSSWDSEILFQDIKVSVCVEEVGLYYKNLIAQINNNGDKPIFDADPTLDDYRTKVLDATLKNEGSFALDKIKKAATSIKPLLTQFGKLTTTITEALKTAQGDPDSAQDSYDQAAATLTSINKIAASVKKSTAFITANSKELTLPDDITKTLLDAGKVKILASKASSNVNAIKNLIPKETPAPIEVTSKTATATSTETPEDA